MAKHSLKVCMVSTVKNPMPSFETFLRYHLFLGIDHIIIFFDDPKDKAIRIARRIKGVTVVICGAKHWAKASRASVNEVAIRNYKRHPIFRQALNAETGAKMALKQHADWIFHIDCDEIIGARKPL